MPAFSTSCCISFQARDQITPLPEMITGFFALEREEESIDLLGIAERTRIEDRPARHRPVDLFLGDFGVEDVAGEIEVGGTRLAAHGMLEGVVHLLGDALEVQDAIGPLDAAPHDRDLVNLLEHLPAELEGRARAAD